MSAHSPSSSNDKVIPAISHPPVKDLKICLGARSKEVFSSVCRFLEAIPVDSVPILIASVGASQISEMMPFVSNHEYRDRDRHRVTLQDLINPSYHFSGTYPGRYLFVPPAILHSSDVSACQILCYDPRLIHTVASLQPSRFIFFLLKRQFSYIRSNVPGLFDSAFNFE
jgi:hypothetical protein